MKEEQKNLLLAMGLSLAVIVGWQYFFVPKPAQRPAQTQTQPVTPAESPAVTGKPATTPATPGQPAATAGAPPAPGAATPGTAPVAPGVAVPPGARALAAPRDRKAALADSPRVAIDSPALIGSIALKGGRIDDIRLKNYKVSIKPDSDIITLMSPPGAPEPYYSETGFVSPDTSLALPKPDTLWTSNDRQLAPGKPVTLTWDNGKGLTFKRVISVDEHYLFTVADSIENKSAAPVTVHPYALLHRIGRPKTEGFYVLHEGLVGIIGDSKVQEITYDSIFKEKNNARVMKGTSGWIGITDKYWATALIPDQKVEFDGRFWGAPGTGTTAAPLTPATYQTDVLEAARTLAPGASSTATHLIFAGAKESQQIDAYQAKYNIKNFDLMIDWGWFYFITKPLFFVIDFLYKYLGNFGFAILMATVLIKLVFFPLANRSYESMAKMKAVQPEMQALQKRYENDKQKMQQELMALYKREKINPIAGCWPILIQIPVFFALYKVIFITIEMRHAPFVGWIRDLSAQDPTNLFNLFGALPFDPAQAPVIGPFLHMGVWPILMGITMFLQMKMNPEPTDPVQKAMFAWMPLIFTFMLASFPAGLVIYWTWNNILSVAQQYFIMRKQGVKVELWDNLMGMFRKKAA